MPNPDYLLVHSNRCVSYATTNSIRSAGFKCRVFVLQLDGTISAKTGARAWGSGLLQWLEFTKLNGISIQGSGVINGQGKEWWTYSDSDDDDDDDMDSVRPDHLTASLLNKPIKSRQILIAYFGCFQQYTDQEMEKMPPIKPTVCIL